MARRGSDSGALGFANCHGPSVAGRGFSGLERKYGEQARRISPGTIFYQEA